MRLLGLVIVGLVLGHPAAAQAVKPADLVGQWVQQGEKEPTLILRADSTLTIYSTGTVKLLMGQQRISSEGRWHLTGDTLVVGESRALVKLEGQFLTTTGLAKDAKPRVYERLATPKP